MKKPYQHKKEYQFSPDDEKKVFNLILKNTIEKELTWIQKPCESFLYRGQIGQDSVIFYKGLVKTCIAITNKTESAYFVINKEQEGLLKKVIDGRTALELEHVSSVAKNLWSGKTFVELSKTGKEPE